MKTRTIYIDVETTGLIKYVHGIIALAYIIEDEEGKVLTEGKLEMNTLEYKSKISEKALEVNKYTREDIASFQPPKEALTEFIETLNHYFSNKTYKVIAYNADFDTGFLQEWFDKLIPSTYWKLLDYKHVDPFALIKIYQYLDIVDTGKKQSLEVVAEHFNIEHTPHCCVSDIHATRELWIKLKRSLVDNRTAIMDSLVEGE